MNATPGEGSGELKQPHDTAAPDNDTPRKKTFSDTPTTPASDASAIRTERALLAARHEEVQIKVAAATKRQAEALRTMQELLQELQALRLEEEDIRVKLDALKGEESAYSATVSADSSHKWPRSWCYRLCGKECAGLLYFGTAVSVVYFLYVLLFVSWWCCQCTCCFFHNYWFEGDCLLIVSFLTCLHCVFLSGWCALTRLAQVYHSQVLHSQGLFVCCLVSHCFTLPAPCLWPASYSFVLAAVCPFSVARWVEALC